MAINLENTKNLKEYLSFFRRRKYWLIIPAIFVFTAMIMLALGLPATYRSEATILVEKQEVPDEFVRTTISTFADQRVQVIARRVLTLDNIKAIIEKFDLYQENDSVPPQFNAELAQIFSKNMSLDMVSAEMIDPRSGRETQATIAFTIAFEDRSPDVAQEVASELVTFFLDENVRERNDKAASVSAFLSEEAEGLNKELLKIEQQLANFKAANEGSLPELYQFNLAALERAQNERSNVRLRIQELEKKKIELSAELSSLSPSAPVVLTSGDVVLSDVDRLRALESEYRRATAIYNNNHPDVIRLNREIKTLRTQLGNVNDTTDLRKQLNEQQQYLANLETKYSSDYHEVKNTKRIIENLKLAINNKEASLTNNTLVEADNPTYVLLQTQLRAAESEIVSLNTKSVELESKVLRYEALIRRSPEVEKGYKALLRDYNTASAKYQDISAKLRAAGVAQSLEQEQKGERFTLVEPASFPISPAGPNRKAILFLGFIAAGAAGIGFGVVRETIDGTIKSDRELSSVMGEHPLVEIPYIENNDDRKKKLREICYVLIAIILISLLLLSYAHFFFKPLDVLVYSILDKLGLG